MKISASTIDFGLNPKSKIISVEPNDESCQMLWVKYSAAPASDVSQVWYLTKVFGRQIQIRVNAENPGSITVYQRDRTWL
jgi:hypothetical protein